MVPRLLLWCPGCCHGAWAALVVPRLLLWCCYNGQPQRAVDIRYLLSLAITDNMPLVLKASNASENWCHKCKRTAMIGEQVPYNSDIKAVVANK